MTGLVRRTGLSTRVVRTGIELTVVLLGWLLGGTVGLGTLLFAVAIGPLVQPMLPWFAVPLPDNGAEVTRRSRADIRRRSLGPVSAWWR